MIHNNSCVRHVWRVYSIGPSGAMTSDLTSYRMLFVAAKEEGRDRWYPGHELWRQGAELAPVPIDFSAHDAIAARAALQKEKVDFCVLDAKLPPDERSLVLDAKHPEFARPKMILTGLSAGAPDARADFI